MLEPVGITSAQETLFRHLIDHPRSTAADLAAAVDAMPTAVHSMLDDLEELGLVVRVTGPPASFQPALPDLAIERLIMRRQEELEEVREVARELAAQFRQKLTTRPRAVAEVISGAEAVAHHTRQLHRSATRTVLVTDRPPYLDPSRPDFQREEIELLGRGVSCRRVYHRPALDLADHVAHLEAYLAAGEQARVLHDVPLKMLVVDARRALVPLEPDEAAYGSTVLVHAKPLVDALTLCFEALWERAVPIKSTAPGGLEGTSARRRPAAQDRQLLTLLAAGLKDEAVARQLGLSSRTVVRRVDRLMKELGADTRFQAGLQAVRKGWL